MQGSFEAYWIDRANTPAVEFEGIFTADYVARFVAEARAEGFRVELVDGEFVRVTFESGLWREFYPVAAVAA